MANSPYEVNSGEPMTNRISDFKAIIKNNSVALVRERTIPTEPPPLVGAVSANFADRRASLSQRCGSPTAVISVF
jgi:hypothetical protein